MPIYFETDYTFVIDSCLISTCYPIINYDFFSNEQKILVNDHEFKLSSLRKGIDKFGHNILLNDYLVYLKFEIFLENDKEMVMAIHNNTKKTKIWFNNQFIAYTNDWYERFVIKMHKGKNIFLIEVENLERYTEFFIV